MDDHELLGKVRTLRGEGRTPKQVARTLGVPPAKVAALVRQVAREEAAVAPEPEVMGCWVSPGWREGLDAPADWPDHPVPDGVGHGVVTVLVARAHRRGKVSVAGYLVDVYCLGVKDVLGPQVMDDWDLRSFTRAYFLPFEAPPVAAPIEMARELVWGAVQYARGLGFEPHRDFERTAAHLGAWAPTGRVRFGRDGQPFFVEGAHDDSARVLRTLERAVGQGNFHFIVAA